MGSNLMQRLSRFMQSAGIAAWTVGRNGLAAAALLFTGLFLCSAAAPKTYAQTEEADDPKIAEVASRFESDIRSITKSLGHYNKKAHIAVHRDRHWNAKITDWKIEGVEPDRFIARINFEVGRWDPSPGAAIFEIIVEPDGYHFVSHRPLPKDLGGAGVLATSQNLGCVYNYYASRPCPGTLRIWREFTELHGLEMNGETAKALQAYKHHDFETGNRFMARAQGLPDPSGESVFSLQAEITALDLSQYQNNPAEPCDLSPYGPRPCPEVVQIFKDFADKHGLEPDLQTAKMFEAYGNNDYRKADVTYALAKGLPIPAYGFIPTGVAREIAALNLSQYQKNPAEPCDLNPYGVKPCLETIEIWRDFAERYQLDDNQRNAAILQAYASGEYKQGDQLLAQAKGVSLEQLLEASGVPTEGLVIEVFPSRKQSLLRQRTGT